MNCTLSRTGTIPNGITGVMDSDDGTFTCVTLERTWNGAPKVPAGTYTCVLGQHQLEGMAQPFQAYELQDVPGHTNILIHVANYVTDLEGCIGVGDTTGENMICNSRDAFNRFMTAQGGCSEFQLTVKE